MNMLVGSVGLSYWMVGIMLTVMVLNVFTEKSKN